MRKIVTRFVIVFTLLCLVVLGGCSNGSPSDEETKFTMIIATATTNDQQHLALDKLKELIESKTDKIEVQTYPSGQLGTNDQMHQELLSGDLHLLIEPTAFMGGFCSVMNVVDLPYFLDDSLTASKLLNGPAGDDIRNYVEEKMGVLIGGFYSYGDRVTMTKFPVNSISDFSGKKIRIMGAKVLQDQFDSWGGAGIPMGPAELYTSLQQGAVDGLESGVTFFYTGKYYEVCDYIVTEPNASFLSISLINKDWLNSLPDDLAKIVSETALEVADYFADTTITMEEEAMKVMTDAGVEVIEVSPALRDDLKRASQQVHDIFLRDNPDAEQIYKNLEEVLKR